MRFLNWLCLLENWVCLWERFRIMIIKLLLFWAESRRSESWSCWSWIVRIIWSSMLHTQTNVPKQLVVDNEKTVTKSQTKHEELVECCLLFVTQANISLLITSHLDELDVFSVQQHSSSGLAHPLRCWSQDYNQKIAFWYSSLVKPSHASLASQRISRFLWLLLWNTLNPLNQPDIIANFAFFLNAKEFSSPQETKRNERGNSCLRICRSIATAAETFQHEK